MWHLLGLLFLCATNPARANVVEGVPGREIPKQNCKAIRQKTKTMYNEFVRALKNQEWKTKVKQFIFSEGLLASNVDINNSGSVMSDLDSWLREAIVNKQVALKWIKVCQSEYLIKDEGREFTYRGLEVIIALNGIVKSESGPFRLYYCISCFVHNEKVLIWNTIDESELT